MHFFSPVDKMPLVEIITGEKTSDEAIARAFDVVQQIKKTPIVVNDSRGFFTSRVFGTLLTEGAALLDEGVDPQTIERAATHGRLPGAAAGDARRGLADADPARSARPPRRPPRATASSCREQPGHGGRSTGWSTSSAARARRPGAGFYDYPADAQEARSGRGCASTSAEADVDVPLVDIQERLPVPDGARDRALLRRGRHRARPPPRTSARSWASASRRCTAARCSTCRATRAPPAPAWRADRLRGPGPGARRRRTVSASSRRRTSWSWPRRASASRPDRAAVSAAGLPGSPGESGTPLPLQRQGCASFVRGVRRPVGRARRTARLDPAPGPARPRTEPGSTHGECPEQPGQPGTPGHGRPGSTCLSGSSARRGETGTMDR